MDQEADYSAILALTWLQLSSCVHLPHPLSLGAPLGAERSAVSSPSCLPLSVQPALTRRLLLSPLALVLSLSLRFYYSDSPFFPSP